MSKERVVRAVDLFCGAGGTSTGLARACQQAGARVELTAINCWPRAIESHRANHPWAKHLCQRIEQVLPEEVVPGGKLDLLIASPECTHHSRARGARPVSDQLRSSAWLVLRWLQNVRVESVLIENVPEFEEWGPLTAKGRPMKARKGEVFTAWRRSIEAMGYTVDWRVLNAADYGDPTTRRRLFVLARRGRKPLPWPRQTHSKAGKLPGTRRWRAAREVIDWSLPGESIFARKTPLAPATMRRILAGLERFGGPELRPFLVLLTHGGRVHDLDQPVPTVTGANRGEMGLVEPFMLSQASGGAPRPVSEPMPGMVTQAAPFLVRPFLVGAGGPEGTARPKSVEEPVPTVLAENRVGVVQPFILPPNGVYGGNVARGVDEPAPTVTAGRGAEIGLVRPFLVANFMERDGQAPRVHDITEPLPAVTSRGAGDLVQPYLVEYYGNGDARSVEEPVPTVTTKDRVGLVMPVINGIALDIRFRMLQPHELAAAMGFGAEYKFSGNRGEVVKQIGNAVAVNMAQALCTALLTGVQQPVLDVLEEPGGVAA